MHSESTLPIHPFTGMQAIGWTRRGPVWPVMGGAEDGGSGSEGGAEGGEVAGAGKSADAGGTGWTPPTDQAALDKIIESRLARERAKFPNYEELKTKADQHDALLEELSSDAEKAAQKAREDALTEANSKAIPRVVKAEFKAAAKGVLTAEQLASLLEDRDLTKYVNADGDPDEEKIANLVKAFAPANGNGDREFPDLGGGNRGGAAKSTDMNSLIRRAAGVNT